MFRKIRKLIPDDLVVAIDQIRFRGVLCLVVVLALCPMIPAPAEEIAYPGVLLQNIPGGWAGSDCLAPSGSNTGKSNSLSDNEVTVLISGTVPGQVFGAYNNNDTNVIANNAVFIYGNVNRNVYGGYSFFGDVTGNIVTISGGTVSINVYGGWSDSGNVIANNAVFIYGNVNGYVYGGRSDSGNATNNTVNINGGTADLGVYGGWSEKGHATNNNVTISGGKVNFRVYGGWSNFGSATGNSVNIRGGALGSSVYGGWSDSGNATGNSVEISGGTAVIVYGGWSDSGNATNNTVNVSGGTVNSSVYGGWSDSCIASNNIVTISNGTVNFTVEGGRGSYATGNSVNISGGTVEYVFGSRCSFGNATGNSVNISGGTVGWWVVGGWSDSGNATGNSVEISDGAVGGAIYGGYIWDGTGNATGNTVTISGGTVSRDIYGGYISNTTNTGKATGNTVTISGTPDLTSSNIYGGWSNNTVNPGDVFTGNTFHLYNTSVHNATHTITAKGLANFQNLNFYVPASAKDGDVMLEITDTANIDNSRLKVVFDVANSSLKSFDKITLIDTSSSGAKLVGLPESMVLNPARGVQSLITQAKKGALMLVDVEITVEHESGSPQGQLNLYILGADILPEAGAVNDGYLPGIMQLNQGGDRIAEQPLMSKMMCASKHPDFLDLGVFCDISGNWSRYHTGAQTDLSGTNLLLGLSKCFRLKPLFNGGQVTQLMLGGFFEHGNGSYNSFSAFDNGVNVRAGGKLDSYGGGVLGRWDFGKFRIHQDYAHSYIDGSFRAGSLRNRFHSDLRDSFDTPAGFTSNSPYHGTHVGIGRVRHFASGATFELSGKYFWTQMQGKSLKLTTGDPVDFESVNSHRFRLGGRYNLATNSRVTPYLGGSWEREFGGTARSSTSGFAIPASSLRGDTGIGEVGIALKPATHRGFFVDLGVQCYGGKRDGVAAALYAGRKF